MTQIVIDTDRIPELIKEGGKLVLRPEADSAIAELLTMLDHLEAAKTKIAEQIKEAALQVDPNFKGVVGERVKAIFRTYGEKYTYDYRRKDELEAFLKETVYTKVDSKKVDEYIKEVGELPEGITEKDREAKLSISLINEQNQLEA